MRYLERRRCVDGRNWCRSCFHPPAQPSMFRNLLTFVLAVTTAQVCASASTPWFETIQKGDVASVTRMLDQGADLEAKNEWHGTALSQAVWSQKEDVAKLLLSRGANPNAQSDHGAPL